MQMTDSRLGYAYGYSEVYPLKAEKQHQQRGLDRNLDNWPTNGGKVFAATSWGYHCISRIEDSYDKSHQRAFGIQYCRQEYNRRARTKTGSRRNTVQRTAETDSLVEI